jgi:hypothetical protein
VKTGATVSPRLGGSQCLRFAERGKYIGVDVEAGPGVDVVLDLTARLEEIDRQLGGMQFGAIFCLSVPEHCRQPFLMAENLTCLLRPGGKLCLSVPFAWEFHGYPSDYWRFTSEGVRILFDDLIFDPASAPPPRLATGNFCRSTATPPVSPSPRRSTSAGAGMSAAWWRRACAGLALVEYCGGWLAIPMSLPRRT